MRYSAKVGRIALVLVLSGMTSWGCTSAKQDEETLAADDQGEESAEATAEEASGDAASVDEASPEAEPAPVAAAAEPASAPATVDAGRVVRFVSANEAAIQAAPDAAAGAVGKLLKGDRVMVVEEGGWGRIADGMFVKLDQLSAKAVPRDRQPAAWIPPSH